MKIGPQYKIARRLGARIFPKTQTAKFTISGTDKKRPGGKRGGGGDFGVQLIEKQKARLTYGVSEKQFSNYVEKVRQIKAGTPAANLHKQLELRLDNVVYRLGLASSRRFARQAVSHGHIMINGRKTTIPSYQVKVNDVISVRPGSKDNGIFRDFAAKQKDVQIPEWLTFDAGKMTATVKHDPKAETVAEGLNFGTILEFYSRV